ncbi:MAG: SUMF1/EgtB/PvdO family nonheme iron enzyme [Planctomycetota bacterium]
MAYCAALTVSETAAGRVPAGYQYRLPTEAEWEYCYRAGTTTEYWFGPTLACGQTHFSYTFHSNSYCGSPSGQSSAANVGSYPANPWGLHDVAGNVWEWCLDSWDFSANYPASAVSDPYVTTGPDRVLRGGGWGSGSGDCRAANRHNGNPGDVGDNIGFRVVLAPVLVP